MALHPHDRETVIRDTTTADGPATAMLVIIGLVVAGFLIWLFAFSPVFHNNTTPTNPGQPQQNVQVDNGGGAPAAPNTQTQPQPNAPAPVAS